MTNDARVLYGREAERATLAACLAELFAGRGQLVVIGGEAGIGKTTLVTTFAAEARERGAFVLAGACYDLSSAPPYGAWIEIARSYGPNDELPSLPAFVTSEVAFERLAGREAMFGEMLAFLQSLAERHPLVLVIDDAHGADQASLDLLRYVARQLAALPILILVTYRDADLAPSDALYRTLPNLVRETRAARIMLRRLGSDAVGHLVVDRYALLPNDATRLLAWLDQLAEGNPFFVGELLQMLESEQTLRRLDDGWVLGDLRAARVPPLVRQLIDERLARLDPAALQLLQVAATIGSVVAFDLWQEVAGASDDALVAVIEPSQQARLLVEEPGRDAYRFGHALVREALYNSLVLPRRRAWHRRIGETLASQPQPDPDAVAHHFRHADDQRAVEWLARAGERATRQFAWPTAVERFRAALDQLGDDASTAWERAWLRYHIGMLSRRSNVAEAVASLERSLQLATGLHDPLLLGFATADLGLLYCIAGRIAEGLPLIERGADLLDALAEQPATSGMMRSAVPSGAGDAHRPVVPTLGAVPATRRAFLVNWLSTAGRYDEAIAHGRALLERIPDHPPHPRYDDFYDACIGLASASTTLGRPAETRELLDRARAGYSAVELLPWLYFMEEVRFVTTYRLDAAAERDRIQDLVRYVWLRHTAGAATYTRVHDRRGSLRLHFLQGQWDIVEESIGVSPLSPSTSIDGLSSALLVGELLRHRGDLAAAREQLRLIIDRYRVTSFGEIRFPSALMVHELAADLALDAGDLDGARPWIDTHAAWLERSGAVIGWAEHHLLLARYAEQEGDLTGAREHAGRAVAHGAEPRQPLALLRALRAAARLDGMAGRLADADMNLAEALDLSEACAVPYERALTLLVRAGLRQAAGDMPAAREALVEARAICEPLHALPALEQVSDLERRLADGPRVRTTVAGLSERELDVLRLVARGLTDADVAERLFISPRTVSGHLQSIYNKLGVSSRTAASAFAFEHGLV
jgi:DNA-binding CsgD family transcriptional regulator